MAKKVIPTFPTPRCMYITVKISNKGYLEFFKNESKKGFFGLLLQIKFIFDLLSPNFWSNNGFCFGFPYLEFLLCVIDV